MDCSISTAICLLCLVVSINVCAVLTETCRELKYCERCPRNERDEPICEKCYDFGSLFVLDTKEFPPVCRKCSELPGCLLCSSTRLCDLCMDPANYGPDFNGAGTCSRCAENCGYCGKLGSGKCDTCLPGYRQNEKGTCSGCPRDCQLCSEDLQCLKCNAGHYLNDKEDCTPCQKNCVTCEDDKTCHQCENGYGLDKSQKCVRIQADNDKISSDNQGRDDQ